MNLSSYFFTRGQDIQDSASRDWETARSADLFWIYCSSSILLRASTKDLAINQSAAIGKLRGLLYFFRLEI
jgi:hypothetical protein